MWLLIISVEFVAGVERVKIVGANVLPAKKHGILTREVLHSRKCVFELVMGNIFGTTIIDVEISNIDGFGKPREQLPMFKYQKKIFLF